MTTRLAAGLAGLAVALLAALPAQADSLLRRGASAINGSISNVTRTGVTIKPANRDAETVPANEIVRARWDGEPPRLNILRGYEEAGNLESALREFKELLPQLPAANAPLKAEVEFLIARATARLALTDAAKRDEALKKLEDWRTAHANHFRYFESYDWQGQLHLAQGNFDAARAAFEQMAQAPWTDYKMAARIGNARVLMRQEQFAEALREFEAVAGTGGDSGVEAARKLEARLGKATCLHRQEQYAEAAKELEDIIHSVSPDDTAIQAEAYLRQGDSLQAMGQTQDALLAYLHVDLLFSRETSRHAESLYHLSRLWNAVNRADRAGEAAARLQQDYPNSEWARRLAGGQ